MTGRPRCAAAGEHPRGTHRADRVGAGRADADREQVEDRDGHGNSSKRGWCGRTKGARSEALRPERWWWVSGGRGTAHTLQCARCPGETGLLAQTGVQRVLLRQCGHPGLERLRVGLPEGRGAFSASAMTSATSAKSSAVKPRVARAGVPIRRPEVTIGGRGSFGTALRLTVMPTSWRRSSACWPSSSESRRSTRIRWTSVPPERTFTPAARASGAVSRSARIRAPSTVRRWRSLKSSEAATLKETALAAITCSRGRPGSPGRRTSSASSRRPSWRG